MLDPMRFSGTTQAARPSAQLASLYVCVSSWQRALSWRILPEFSE